MTDLANISRLGVAKEWPSRATVVRRLEKTTPWSIEPAIAYNARTDRENEANSPQRSAYIGVGARLLGDAQAQALRGDRWEQDAINALGYLSFAAQLDLFWHVQFRSLFPNQSRPLRMMDWELMTETMGMLFMLGRIEEGIYQGYLTHAAINRTYQLKQSYEQRHRRVHAFILRLFAAWRGDVNHEWPAFAYSEPIYEGILETWQNKDPGALTPWLLAACDRHTHESKRDSETRFFDCSAFPRTPIEILFLFRLRELIGLENPVLDHPLMEQPFEKLPGPQLPYVPDSLVEGTLARVRTDWPEFDRIVSVDALKIA